MQIEGIHHVSLLVTDLERSRAFYRDIVGLEEIERPPFSFPGAWFRIGEGGQQLHLIVYYGETLRSGGIDTRDGHFAIRVKDFDETLARLKQHGVDYVANRDSVAGFAQIFVLDPDRNIIEFNAPRQVGKKNL